MKFRVYRRSRWLGLQERWLLLDVRRRTLAYCHKEPALMATPTRPVGPNARQRLSAAERAPGVAAKYTWLLEAVEVLEYVDTAASSSKGHQLRMCFDRRHAQWHEAYVFTFLSGDTMRTFVQLIESIHPGVHVLGDKTPGFVSRSAQAAIDSTRPQQAQPKGRNHSQASAAAAVGGMRDSAAVRVSSAALHHASPKNGAASQASVTAAASSSHGGDDAAAPKLSSSSTVISPSADLIGVDQPALEQILKPFAKAILAKILALRTGTLSTPLHLRVEATNKLLNLIADAKAPTLEGASAGSFVPGSMLSQRQDLSEAELAEEGYGRIRTAEMQIRDEYAEGRERRNRLREQGEHGVPEEAPEEVLTAALQDALQQLFDLLALMLCDIDVTAATQAALDNAGVTEAMFMRQLRLLTQRILREQARAVAPVLVPKAVVAVPAAAPAPAYTELAVSEATLEDVYSDIDPAAAAAAVAALPMPASLGPAAAAAAKEDEKMKEAKEAEQAEEVKDADRTLSSSLVANPAVALERVRGASVSLRMSDTPVSSSATKPPAASTSSSSAPPSSTPLSPSTTDAIAEEESDDEEDAPPPPAAAPASADGQSDVMNAEDDPAKISAALHRGTMLQAAAVASRARAHAAAQAKTAAIQRKWCAYFVNRNLTFSPAANSFRTGRVEDPALRQLIRSTGVPQKYRARVWKAMCGVDRLRNMENKAAAESKRSAPGGNGGNHKPRIPSLVPSSSATSGPTANIGVGYYRDLVERGLEMSRDPLAFPAMDARVRDALEHIERDFSKLGIVTRAGAPPAVTAPSSAIISLHRVLLAYVQRNPQMGYLQNLNHIVSLLLLVLEEPANDAAKPSPAAAAAAADATPGVQIPSHEEDAFYMLIIMLEEICAIRDADTPRVPHTSPLHPLHPQHSPAGEPPLMYFAGSMLGLRIDQEVFGALLQAKLPRVHAHLTEELAIPLEPFLLSWWLHLWILTLPLELTLRVWDLLLSEGVKVLFRVGLTVLHLAEDAILATRNPQQLLLFLRGFIAHGMGGTPGAGALGGGDDATEAFVMSMYNTWGWMGSLPMSRVFHLRRWYRARMESAEAGREGRLKAKQLQEEQQRRREEAQKEAEARKQSAEAKTKPQVELTSLPDRLPPSMEGDAPVAVSPASVASEQAAQVEEDTSVPEAPVLSAAEIAEATAPSTPPSSSLLAASSSSSLDAAAPTTASADASAEAAGAQDAAEALESSDEFWDSLLELEQQDRAMRLAEQTKAAGGVVVPVPASNERVASSSEASTPKAVEVVAPRGATFQVASGLSVQEGEDGKPRKVLHESSRALAQQLSLVPALGGAMAMRRVSALSPAQLNDPAPFQSILQMASDEIQDGILEDDDEDNEEEEELSEDEEEEVAQQDEQNAEVQPIGRDAGASVSATASSSETSTSASVSVSSLSKYDEVAVPQSSGSGSWRRAKAALSEEAKAAKAKRRAEREAKQARKSARRERRLLLSQVVQHLLPASSPLHVDLGSNHPPLDDEDFSGESSGMDSSAAPTPSDRSRAASLAAGVNVEPVSASSHASPSSAASTAAPSAASPSSSAGSGKYPAAVPRHLPRAQSISVAEMQQMVWPTRAVEEEVLPEELTAPVVQPEPAPVAQPAAAPAAAPAAVPAAGPAASASATEPAVVKSEPVAEVSAPASNAPSKVEAPKPTTVQSSPATSKPASSIAPVAAAAAAPAADSSPKPSVRRSVSAMIREANAAAAAHAAEAATTRRPGKSVSAAAAAPKAASADVAASATVVVPAPSTAPVSAPAKEAVKASPAPVASSAAVPTKSSTPVAAAAPAKAPVAAAMPAPVASPSHATNNGMAHRFSMLSAALDTLPASAPVALASCYACKKPVTEQQVLALGLHFHPECYNCSCGETKDLKAAGCGHRSLLGEAWLMHGGLLYSNECFTRCFSRQCAVCTKAILPGEVAMVAPGDEEGQQQMHQSCVSCVQCGRNATEVPLFPCAPNVQADASNKDAPASASKRPKYACDACYPGLHAPKCGICSKAIVASTSSFSSLSSSEDGVLVGGRAFHSACLSCAVCKKVFADISPPPDVVVASAAAASGDANAAPVLYCGSHSRGAERKNCCTSCKEPLALHPHASVPVLDYGASTSGAPHAVPFHVSCVRCVVCAALASDASAAGASCIVSGNVYCASHRAQAATVCDCCHKVVDRPCTVTSAAGRTFSFHGGCFCCASCGRPFRGTDPSAYEVDPSSQQLRCKGACVLRPSVVGAPPASPSPPPPAAAVAPAAGFRRPTAPSASTAAAASAAKLDPSVLGAAAASVAAAIAASASDASSKPAPPMRAPPPTRAPPSNPSA